MVDLRKKLIPTNVVRDWLVYNEFTPGTYILLPSDEPETTLVVYVRPEDVLDNSLLT